MIELLISPSVGAVIGYFTNYVAIKMLFRPRRAYHILGRRIPFTPGLIPSKRGKLAEAIAKVVKENLLTEESVRRRLNEENVRRSIGELVDRFFEGFMENVDGYVELFLEKVGNKPLSEIINVRDVEDGIRKFSVSILKGLKEQKRSLNELLPPQVREKLYAAVGFSVERAISLLEENIGDESFRLTVKGHIKRNLSRLFNRYVKIIPERSIDSLSERLSNVAVNFLKDIAEDESLRMKVVSVSRAKAEELLSRPISSYFSLLKPEDEEKLSDAISGSLIRALREGMEKPILETRFFRERLFHLLVNLVKEAGKRNRRYISEVATEKLLEVIELEIPVIMDSLDVESMVRDRVNALPMGEVEELVLKLIDEELKYITLLGGVLGFLIGGLQDILLFVHL